MLDAETIIKTAGYLGIFLVVFAESGLLFGFFLPGDSLLFTAGFFAAQGIFGLSFWPLLVGIVISAILGDSVGYLFGQKIGPKIFRRRESFFFSSSNVKLAEDFYQRHGGKAIILARFVPIVRTFAPILAGVGTMPYSSFLIFNALGGLAWSVLFTSLGYLLGNIPGTEHYIQLIILGIILLSITPGLWHLLAKQDRRQKVWLEFKNFLRRNKR